MATDIKSKVVITPDPDRMRAWIEPAPGIEAIDRDDVLAALQAANVVITNDVGSRIDAYLKTLQAGSPPKDRFLIAEGTPPVEGEDGRFVWQETEADLESTDSDPVDYRAFNTIRTVDKGDVVGQITPPKPGTPGKDVFGEPAAPRRRPEPVRLQDTVALAEDGETINALTAGKVVLHRGKLGIREVLEIRGDIDFECGNVDATTDVTIRGTVRDLFEVKSRKSICVGGAVEAAVLQAGQDVQIRGGVLGHNKGRIVAEGQIHARFCDEAQLRARSELHLAKESINSRLCAGERIMAERAAIIGGRAFARQCVDVHTIGSDAGVPTVLAVGIHPTVFKLINELDVEAKKQQEAVGKIRQMIEPLMANLKRLTPAQKEKATELLAQADELEFGIKAKRTAQQELLERSQAPEPPFIRVNGRVCQKAVVMIDGAEACFHKELRGPIRIERRKIKNVTEMVAINQLTGSITTLISAPCDLDRTPDDDEFEFLDSAPAADTSPPDDPPASE